MTFKKITIILLSDNNAEIKQLRMPKVFLVLAFLLLVPCAAYLSWLIRDYWTIKPEVSRLVQLESENEQQKGQFINLAERISQLSEKMADLQGFDHKLKVMVNLEGGEDTPQMPGVGNTDPSLFEEDDSKAKTHRELVRSMHSSLDALDSEIAIDKKDKARLHEFLENQKNLLVHTPSIWPTKGWLSSRFAYRISPFTGQREFHNGIDISTRIGSPIVAPANGVVASVRWNHLSGKAININHGYGLTTIYAHLSKALVKKGQYVKRGETIALVGSTGRSTGPHLHYEVHVNGVPTNPLRYILD